MKIATRRCATGRKREADEIKRQAEAQARAAETQERIANRFFEYSDADRARQQALAERISPVAERFINENPFATMRRPARTDLTGTYRRGYADELAGIQADEGRALATSADYARGSGAARTGATGMGLGAVFRGSDAARTGARRGFQENLVAETVAQDADRLAGYEEEKERTGLGLNLALQGANLLGGQQAVFDPGRSASVGTSNLAQSVGSRGASADTFRTSATLPGRYSWLGGLAGGALNLASNAVLPGAGLSNIWRRSQPAMR